LPVRRSSPPCKAAGACSRAYRAAPAGGAAQPISTADLLRLLTHLQHYVPAPARPTTSTSASSSNSCCCGSACAAARAARHRRRRHDQPVGLLFAFIDATTTCRPARADRRLHIPLLKVALLDKGLFSRASHPARRLLNEIAVRRLAGRPAAKGVTAGASSASSSGCSMILPKMSAVRRTARRLLAFSQDERRRNELLEQRTRDAEEGRARALQANQQVQQVLNLRLRGRVLPQVVVQMLEQAWSQVLLLAWLKQGEALQAWRDAGRRWTRCWPASLPPHEPQVAAAGAGPAQGAARGLASVALDAAATREFFLHLEQLHLRACAGPGLPDDGLGMCGWPKILCTAEEPPACPARADGQAAAQRQVQRLRIGTWVEVLDDDEPCAASWWPASTAATGWCSPTAPA
jgi:hypothetical protein